MVWAASSVAVSVHDESFATARRQCPCAECRAAAKAALLATIRAGVTGSEMMLGAAKEECLAALSTTAADSLDPMTLIRYPRAGLK